MEPQMETIKMSHDWILISKVDWIIEIHLTWWTFGYGIVHEQKFWILKSRSELKIVNNIRAPENYVFRFDIGSGFGELSSTLPPKIPRGNPPPSPPPRGVLDPSYLCYYQLLRFWMLLERRKIDVWEYDPLFYHCTSHSNDDKERVIILRLKKAYNSMFCH